MHGWTGGWMDGRCLAVTRAHPSPGSSSGSVTLHQWQQLAKPNLGGILHPRPGVLTKDFRELEVDIQHVYSLNDLEEDEPDLSHLSEVHGLGRPSISTKCLSSCLFCLDPPLHFLFPCCLKCLSAACLLLHLPLSTLFV